MAIVVPVYCSLSVPKTYYQHRVDLQYDRVPCSGLKKTFRYGNCEHTPSAHYAYHTYLPRASNVETCFGAKCSIKPSADSHSERLQGTKAAHEFHGCFHDAFSVQNEESKAFRNRNALRRGTCLDSRTRCDMTKNLQYRPSSQIT